MRSRHTVLLLIPALLLGACAETPRSSPSKAPRPEIQSVTLLLGFEPDVQFAAFYLAQRAGYYADAGLDVTIEYKSGADLVRLVADGKDEFGVTDATDVMISRTAGIPVKYVSTLYDHFPVALIGPRGTVPIDPAGLAGKRIGTPGRYGSSWHALLALLEAGGLTAADVTIREYPQFNQVEGLLNGDVDLITGFVANEPLRLAAQGMPVDLMTIDEIAPLPGPGVIVGDALLDADRALVAAFADATLHAQRAIATDPQVGLDAAIAEVPAIAEDRATALAVLETTIGLWRGVTDLPTGNIDGNVWMSGYETMRSLGFIDGSVPVDEMIDQVMGTISESLAPE